MSQCYEVKEKLSGYLDGELPQQESQRVRLHLENCEDCKQLYKEFLEIQNKIQTKSEAATEDVALEKIMQDLGASQSQQWGWLFVIIASLMMMGYALYEFIIETELSSYEKFAMSFLGVGGLLLFFSVLRQRLIASKTDKYKDINL